MLTIPGGVKRLLGKGEARELPGIWLNKNELLALATIQKMLKQLAPSLLGPQLLPLEGKLSELLEKQGLNTPELSQRVKLLDTGKRSVSSGIFEIVAQATFNRRRLTPPKAKAVRDYFGIDLDSNCIHVFEFGKQKIPRYSDNALVKIRQGLQTINAEKIWALKKG